MHGNLSTTKNRNILPDNKLTWKNDKRSKKREKIKVKNFIEIYQ